MPPIVIAIFMGMIVLQTILRRGRWEQTSESLPVQIVIISRLLGSVFRRMLGKLFGVGERARLVAVS